MHLNTKYIQLIQEIYEASYLKNARNHLYGVDLTRTFITNGFPCSVGGATTDADCGADTVSQTPEASSSDDDDGGDADPDPARRRRKSPHLISGKHRNATATDGALLAPRSSVSPTSGTSAPIFPPLEAVNRPTVPTEQAAFYLLRRPQTLRGWACNEDGPIRPIRVGNRLGWPVAQIRAVLGVQ